MTRRKQRHRDVANRAGFRFVGGCEALKRFMREVRDLECCADCHQRGEFHVWRSMTDAGETFVFHVCCRLLSKITDMRLQLQKAGVR